MLESPTTELRSTELCSTELRSTEPCSTGLPKELWNQISTDNPTTYYKLLQCSKVFKLDTDIMKAKFIRKTETTFGIQYRLPNGWLHSCKDHSGYATTPANIWANGNQFWYSNNNIHRDNDQPAIIYANGSQCWYINDNQHRDNDQPAIIMANGDRFWCINGYQHRDHDQPAVIRANGDQCWFNNGIRCHNKDRRL